jgi:hypothetical protein
MFYLGGGSTVEGVEELRNIRLVSRSLKEIATPFLFGSLSLNLSDPYSEDPSMIRCDDILENLVGAGTASIPSTFIHTKTLALTTASNFLEGHRGACTSDLSREKTGLMQSRLYDAISTLTSVESAQ